MTHEVEDEGFVDEAEEEEVEEEAIDEIGAMDEAAVFADDVTDVEEPAGEATVEETLVVAPDRDDDNDDDELKDCIC